MDGECLEKRPFEEAHVEAVIALNESQKGLAPSQAARPNDTGSRGGGDFSARARALLFEPGHPARAELRRHSARAAAALAELEARVAGMEDVATRRDDLVHGDFYQGQLLARGGEVVAVIDVESLGRGCRGYDLATFVMATGWFEAETAAVDRSPGGAHRSPAATPSGCTWPPTSSSTRGAGWPTGPPGPWSPSWRAACRSWIGSEGVATKLGTRQARYYGREFVPELLEHADIRNTEALPPHLDLVNYPIHSSDQEVNALENHFGGDAP